MDSTSKFLSSKSGRLQGMEEYSGLGHTNQKLKSIFTQSATSFTRGNIIWTIPKAKRFRPVDVPTKDVALIDLGSTLSKSSTSLGYGKRYMFRPIETPAPSITHRNLKTSHSKFLQTSPSVPFTRESWDTHKEIPGPGSYDLESALGKTARGVMIKSRNKPLDPVKDNPGPDYYFPINGSVQQSRFASIAFGKSKRYDFTKMAQAKNPGPGAYEILSVFERKSKEFKVKNDLRLERERIENQLISNS